MNRSVEWIELGPTPCEEDCAQLGSPDYFERAQKELKAYQALLYRKFPEADKKGVVFTIKSFNHDFGVYKEVVVMYDTNDEIATEYAYYIDVRTPDKWDDEAKRELGIE